MNHMEPMVASATCPTCMDERNCGGSPEGSVRAAGTDLFKFTECSADSYLSELPDHRARGI